MKTKITVLTKTCWQCRGTGFTRFQDNHGECGVCHGKLVVPENYNPQPLKQQTKLPNKS